MFKLTRLLNYAALFLFIGLGLLAARQVLAQQEQDDATPVTAAEAADTFEPFPPITAGSIVPNPVYYTVTDKENQEITAADASAPVVPLPELLKAIVGGAP